MKLLTSVIVLSVGLAAIVSADPDAFTTTKAKLSSAKCMQITFRSYVRSDVFQTVDTLDGKATIAADGRYRIQLGEDEYLYDGTTLYSYSKENNQLTIQKSVSGASADNEILLLTRLDEIYDSHVITANQQYRLEKKDSLSTMPTPVVMTIDPAKAVVTRLEYKNENDDQTTLDIKQQKLLSTCDKQSFVPNYPASVERIKL